MREDSEVFGAELLSRYQGIRVSRYQGIRVSGYQGQKGFKEFRVESHLA
jgi:hypothetical protein